MKVKLRIHVNIHIFVLIMHFSYNCLCIYKQWQEFAKSRNVAALIDLYNNEAVFESPLVPAILDKLETGILTGRAQILIFWRKTPNGGQINCFAGIVLANTWQMDILWYGNIPEQRPKVIRLIFWS